MKKLFLFVSIFTAIACQLAHARDYYGYERVGRNDSDYIYIDGVRYARVPQKEVVEAQPRFTKLSTEQADEVRFKRKVIDTRALGIRPYFGLDGAVGEVKYSGDLAKEFLNKAYKRVGVFAGLQFNQYVGLEAFYHIGNTKENNETHELTQFTTMKMKNTMDFNSYGADLMGYIPVGKAVDIVLGVGYGWYDFRGKINLSFDNSSVGTILNAKIKDKASEEAVRYTLGTQFLLNNHWAVRILGRYADFTSDDVIKNMIEVSLGLRYMF